MDCCRRENGELCFVCSGAFPDFPKLMKVSIGVSPINIGRDDWGLVIFFEMKEEKLYDGFNVCLKTEGVLISRPKSRI